MLSIVWGVVRILRRAAWLLVVAFLLRYSTLPLGESWARIGLQIGSDGFDFIGWTVDALGAKAGQALWGAHPFMSEDERTTFARDYFADVARAQFLEGDIAAIYAQPDVADPHAASADLRAERDALRQSLVERQSLAEAIIEGQVAAVLVEQGYGLAGQLVPPIAMRFSQAPNLLVISPRNSIRIDLGLNVDPLTVDERAQLEAAVEAAEDVSALVVPIGGIALYPALILETAALPWAVETFAHEWFHHYLFMFPLGWELDFAADSRLINETAANMFGQEIKQIVLARYYPEFAVVREPAHTSRMLAAPRSEPFDFAAEMNETRVTVDALLAEGKIEEAEAYMAERQAYFFNAGYPIRKLNQAYFAFYGGYQVGGVPGIAGEDPIGPALRDLRAASPTLHDFTTLIRGITTREALLELRDEVQGER